MEEKEEQLAEQVDLEQLKKADAKDQEKYQQQLRKLEDAFTQISKKKRGEMA